MPDNYNFPNFKPISLQDKPIFDKFFKVNQPLISELTFSNLFAWRHSKKHEFSVLDDNLIVTFEENGVKKLFQPIGPTPADCIRKALQQKPDLTFERVDESIALQLKDEFNVIHTPDMDDYVYLVKDLVELKGDKYQPKRNFVSRCERKYNPEVCVLDENNVQDFFKMQKKWCNIKGCEDENAKAEDRAVKEVLTNFKRLGVFGICVRINNEIEGFAIGEPLNENTCVEHFEKANTKFTGIFQYLLHEFVIGTPEQFSFINREQDLGIEGLRKSKESYYPDHMVKKYSVSTK